MFISCLTFTLSAKCYRNVMSLTAVIFWRLDVYRLFTTNGPPAARASLALLTVVTAGNPCCGLR